MKYKTKDFIRINPTTINEIERKYVKDILNYKAFTDIEFNALKSRNCQAHSVCIFLSLFKKWIIDEALLDFSNFKKLTLDIYDNEITF